MSAPVVTVCPTNTKPSVSCPRERILARLVGGGVYAVDAGMGELDPVASAPKSGLSSCVASWGLVVLAGVVGFVLGRASQSER